MKHKLPFAALAVLGALMLVVLSGVPSTIPAHAQNSPSVAVELSSASVEEGTAIAVTMSFGSLTFDDDRAIKDYIFRADVVGADQCEEQAGGYGLGVDRYMYQVDEDPEVRRGTISADCPAGDYTVRASISDANGGELASASASFSVAAPEPAPTQDPGSNQQDPDPPAPPIVLLAIPSEFTGGEEAQISMGFSGLEFDSDRSTIDYIFRADVKDSEDGDADGCENQAGGYGLGVDRYMYQVDEDPETRSGTISADCPAGDYTIRASISSSGNQELASSSAPFSVAAPTADEVDDPDTDLASVSSRDITLHSSNQVATGVWSDGTTVWVSDADADKLFAYTLADGTRDTSKEFSTHSDNGSGAGMWSNDTTIWVADSSDLKFYAYTLAGGARDSGRDFNTALSASVVPRGMWSNGTTMWMANAGDNTLYAYTLSSGARDTGKDFSLHSDNANPWGIWSDDATIWVGDRTDNKVYAYTLSNGARVAGKDFDLVADNSVPRGIWSNGMITWVADTSDNKLYAYDLPVSADATLSALTVSPGDVIGFASDTTTYHVGVANSVTQATITATTNDANATVAWSTTDAGTAAGHQVSLSEGLNTVTITVTAEDTNTEEVYTIHIGRGVTADYGWKATDDFNGLVAAGNEQPQHIWSNGTTMWVTDFTDNKIFAYTRTTKAREPGKEFTLAADNTYKRGIWSDSTTMWVVDTSANKIFAYNLATKARDASKDFTTLRDAGNTGAQGIWSDGTTMWVADSGDDKIYAYNLATRERDTGKDFNTLAAGNTDPTGIWSDSATMWVVDQVDAKIYAYSVVTKARDASKDFTTLTAAGIGGPQGIWSDGTTMWVADFGGKKLYSYNMPPPPASDDATLSALTVSPTNIIGFASDVTEYHVGVANSVTYVTITAATTDPNADIYLGQTPLTSGQSHRVSINEGLNLLAVETASADNNVAGSYLIKVGRGVTTAFGWKATEDLNGLLAAGNALPTGIWSNGATMWVADFADDKIYAYSLATKARDPGKDIDALAAAGNGAPSGIWSNGATMWVADLADDKIYAYSLATKERDTGREFDTLAAGNTVPQGIWSDGATMWVADGSEGKIYAYNLATKGRDAAKEFDTLTAAGNTAPQGIWSDDATMWVADNGGDKIYAYGLATKERDTGREFDTLDAAGNREQRGMWSDGETMWVVDLGGNKKIYSYNMPPSRNANLESISVNGLRVSGVNRVDTEYTHTVEFTVRTVTVAATAAHPGASVTSITPADSDTAASGHQVALNPDGETPTEVTITVTAADGTSIKTYTLSVGFRPKDAPPVLLGLKLVYRPAVEHILIGRCSGAPGITCAVGEPGATVFDVDTGTVDAVTVAANPTSPHATVSIDHPDFDSATGGHQVKLAGLGTSGITIKVTVANRDGARATYRINVTRQLSGDTRLGALSVTETGSGVFVLYESVYTDPDSGQRLVSNLEPEFITEWDEATGQPRRARYRATLLIDSGLTPSDEDTVTVTAKELHAGATVHISATDVDGISSLFDADRNAEGFQISLLGSAAQQMFPVVINVRAENGAFHDYDLVFVKRDRVGSPPPVLAEVFKGSNHHTYRPSMFVDWVDWQYPILSIQGLPRPRDCDKAYNVATEYISDTRQGWFSHPVTNHDQDGDPVLGNAGITYQQMTHRWLDSDSLEAAFGPATAERRDTTIEVWCGPRPYSYKDEDGNDQQANGDSRLVGTATIEFPDAPPAPEEPTAAPETPTGLAGRLHGNEATLTWDTVAGASGYELSIKVGDAWMDIDPAEFQEKYRLTVVVGEGTATMSTLYDSSYEFRVRAVNDIGASDWSEAATLEY